MKTGNLSLATVVLGALAVCYSACSAEGQDNTVPSAPPPSNGGASSAAGSAGAPVASSGGRAGAPTQQSGAGAPTGFAGAINTGVGGAFTSGGASGKAGGPPTGGAGAPTASGCPVSAGTLTELLIDDLDDGDDAIRPIGARVGYWYTYNDKTVGATQVPAPSTLFKGAAPGRGTSAFAATTSGSGFTVYGAGMGFAFNSPASKTCTYDASAYKGITFWAKANTGSMAMTALNAMVKTAATTAVSAGGTCATKCDDHYALKPAPVLSTTWSQHTITFASTATFGQNGFGTAVATFEKAKIIGMQFQVAQGVTFDISVDDITFF